MATQLQFSRHAHAARVSDSFNGSDASSLAWEASHHHVAFAVHDAVPSPQLYQQKQPQRVDRHAFDSTKPIAWETPVYERNVSEIQQPMNNAPERTMGNTSSARFGTPESRKSTVKKTAKPSSSRRSTPTPKPVRKPGWDSGAPTNSNLFDTTLKKSVLFQPRPGDRLREVRKEERLTRGSGVSTSVSKTPRKSSSAWNARIATTLPAQPKRLPKDYVKANMEQITGQRYETIIRRSQATAPTRHRGSVFERLSAPIVSKSLLRFRSPSPTRAQLRAPELSEQKDGSVPIPTKLTISSPVIANYQHEESQRSPSRGRSAATRLSTMDRSRPIRERASSPPSIRRSPPSRTSSPGFRSERGDINREQNSMPERVFDVLDREQCGRIGVEQILNGLRLLQLPATHNQVSDYVYLIHEGTVNTIDYEEWSILVGTLDAASASVGGPTRTPTGSSRSSPLPPPSPIREPYSPPQSRNSVRHSPPRSLNQVPSPPKSIHYGAHPDTRTWPQQHGPTSLSVTMPESRLTKIAKHSDDLADLLLEDLLLDTVEELNKQERRQTERKRQHFHAETLESILQQINHIEVAEAELIDNGFALGYKIDGHGISSTAPLKEVRVEAPLKNTLLRQNEGNLVMPLGVISAVNGDFDAASSDGEPVVTLAHHAQFELVDGGEGLGESAPTEYRVEASMSVLSGRLFQNIEKNRGRFLKHRQLVESSLAATGMDQASVIETLADLLLDEIALECAAELESGVEDLTETLAQTLL